MEGSDYYSLLGLSRDASLEEIRASYFMLARKIHPDITQDKVARAQYIVLQKAFEILTNPKKRELYDATLPPVPTALYSTNVTFSRSKLPAIDEPQLVYALVEFSCNARPESIRSVPIHLSLVLDTSTSMKGERLETVKSSAIQLLRKLKPTDLVNVIAFNDRADVLIPTTPVYELPRLEQRINMLQTFGGTEIYVALEAGLNQFHKREKIDNCIRHLILLTDGHTYGDEDKCYDLLSTSKSENILVSALGIGSDWNDTFLDRLTGITGGSVVFVDTLRNLDRFLEEKVNSVGNTFARGVSFEYSGDPGINIRFAFRISPETGPIEPQPLMTLGNLQYNLNLKVLFEFLISKSSPHLGIIKLAEGIIRMNLPEQGKTLAFPLSLEREFVNDVSPEPPPDSIVDAMARLTLYRLQERARKDVGSGNLQSAQEHLQYLATNLLASGDRELAHIVLVEAEHIKQSKRFSKDGDKRIKYSTRALLSPSGMEVNKL